jgi:RNA polymerase sigma-70 factor (ECF subfamily)
MSDPSPLQPDEPAGDRSLVLRVQSGDQQAAVELYRRYAERLRGLVRVKGSVDLLRHVGEEDILQSVFGSFFRAAQRGYYDVPPGGELWHLLALITLNKIRAKGVFYRAARRDIQQTVSGEGLEQVAEYGPGSDEAAFTLLQIAVEETLAPFTDVQKVIVRLRMDGHEVADIAAKTGRSRRTVERTLQDFRRKLSDQLAPPG